MQWRREIKLLTYWFISSFCWVSIGFGVSLIVRAYMGAFHIPWVPGSAYTIVGLLAFIVLRTFKREEDVRRQGYEICSGGDDRIRECISRVSVFTTNREVIGSWYSVRWSNRSVD
jgi:hypothetical protein